MVENTFIREIRPVPSVRRESSFYIAPGRIDWFKSKSSRWVPLLNYTLLTSGLPWFIDKLEFVHTPPVSHIRFRWPTYIKPVWLSFVSELNTVTILYYLSLQKGKYLYLIHSPINKMHLALSLHGIQWKFALWDFVAYLSNGRLGFPKLFCWYCGLVFKFKELTPLLISVYTKPLIA